MSSQGLGKCDGCSQQFGYTLIHCGFGDLSHGYCNRCGQTALLSAWYEAIPAGVGFKGHRPIGPTVEVALRPCPCGGTFSGTASPRCPRCRHELDALSAATYLEANAPGTAKGWRWQRNWVGIYCIVIEDRFVKDNWLEKHVAV